MACEPRALTEADKEKAFRTATSGLFRWYSEKVTDGMTDAELEAALVQVLGIFGGSCGPEMLSVTHQGSGLKIWAGWHIVNHVTEPPIFAGKRTIAMARHLYQIPNPEDPQLVLL